MGRKLDGSSKSPPLCKEITIARFKQEGNSPVLKETLIASASDTTQPAKVETARNVHLTKIIQWIPVGSGTSITFHSRQ